MRDNRFGVYNLRSLKTFKNAVFAKLWSGYALDGRRILSVTDLLKLESEDSFPIYAVDDNAALWVEL
jgi:hypothetical protein